MKDWRFIIVLAVAWSIGIYIASSASDILGAFFGVFVGVFTCFTLIIALSHLLFLLPSKLGITMEQEEE